MIQLSESQLCVIDNVSLKVQELLSDAEAGHDWWHIHRVYTNAEKIAKEEETNTYVVLIASLLHDIADAKFNDGDETIGPRLAEKIMTSLKVDQDTIDHVINIIKYMSFKNSLGGKSWTSPEMEVVQDADRLDAIGAIGIARAFSYGGYKGREFFDPKILPIDNIDKETYKKSKAPTINHFYEKLLLLKDKMNTPTGQKMANKRHKFMKAYLKQFYNEWYGKEIIPPGFSEGL